MAVKFANNVSTSLSAAINATQTTISVADASGLPTLSSGDYVYLTIDTDTTTPTIEVVKVTAISSNDLTVVRGQDGTTASSFSNGTKVELRVTAAGLDDISAQAQSAADTESVSIDGDTMTGDLTAPNVTATSKVKGASLETDRYIYHAGDTNTYIDFGTDEINFHAGGGANQERLMVLASKINANVAIYGPDDKPLVQYFSTTGAGYFGSTTRSDLTLASSNRPRWRNGNGVYADIVVDGLDASLSSTTISNTAVSSTPLIIGSSSQTNYTQFSIKTDVHDAEAYLIAYGSNHVSEANNFAMKNLQSGGNIFFELASSVKPLTLESTGATFAGNVTVQGDNLDITQSIRHRGDEHTGINFFSDQVVIKTGGNERLNITNSDINIKNTQVFFNSTMGIGASTYAPIENNVDSERNWLNFHRSNNASYVEFTNRTPLGKIVLSGGLDGGGGEVQRLEIEGGSATKSVKVLASTNLNLSSTSKLTHGSSTIIDASRNIESVGTISTDVAMSSSPYLHHFAVSGTNTVGGGAGIVFQTSASAGSRTQFGAKIQGVRSSSDDGSADLEFYTSKASSGAHRLVLTLDEDKDAAFTGNVALDGDLSVKNGQLILGTANTSSGHINAYELMTFNIDTDNDDTNRYFKWTTNANSGSGSQLMYLDESGNLTVSGNFTVQGTTTTLDTATLQVEDKNIVLNYGTGDTSGSADGAGITIQDAVSASTDATLTWNSTNDEFISSHPFQINRTTSGGELLHLYNTYDGGSRDDLIIENTNDRDVGITFKNSVAQYEIWMDGANDDSLIFSPGDNTTVIAMEIYQNKNVDIGGNLQVTGDIETLKGIEFNPNGHSISADSDGNRTLFDFYRNGSIHWQVYHDGSGHLDFIPTSTAYKLKWNSNELLYSGANISVGTIASGVHTITSSGTIGGQTIANGYLKITDGSNTLGIDPNEIMSDDTLYLNSAYGEVRFRTSNTAGAKLFNGSTQFMSADRNLFNIGTISSGNITMTGDQLKIISSTDSNLGWMVRDNTYATDEMDVTATRLGSGNTPTLGLAGQSGINFYASGVNVASFNSAGDATFENQIEVLDGTAEFVISGDSSGNNYLKSSGEIRIRPSGTTINKLVIGSNGNITTAGYISASEQSVFTGNAISGTPNSNAQLVAADSGVAGIAIQTNDGGSSYLWFGDTTDNAVGRIKYDHSTDEVTWRVGATDDVFELDSSGMGKFTELTLKGGSDNLTFTETGGDWSIKNAQQNNGIVIYDGSGGVEIHYNNAVVAEFDSSGGMNIASGELRMGGTTRIGSGGTATFAGVNIINSGMPTLTLYDNGNGGGGAAEAKIEFTNTAGTAVAIGYTDDQSGDTDLIISTNAAGTYGGYLGLTAAAIADAQSDIILEPKTDVRIATGGLKIGTTDLIDSSRNVKNVASLGVGIAAPVKTLEVNYSSATTDRAATLSGGASGVGVLIHNTNTTGNVYANLDFRARDADGRILYQYDGATNKGDFHFITDSLASPTSRLTIKNNGDIDVPGGRTHLAGQAQIGSDTQANSYGRLQVNQSANNDESGIGILDSTSGRSMRLWCDSTTSYINSGNGGSGNLVFNEAVTVSSSGNLSGVGSITASGTHTFTANDVDFIVQDTTDTVTNYIWRQHSTDKLYLGSQNAVVDLRSALKISDTERIDMSGNATLGSISASSDVTVTGARITINDNTDALRLRSQTNGVGVNINFSDAVTDSFSQQGNINYVHGDGAAYGSGNAFIISGTESTMTVLADGKLMFKEGLYLKPASGTGAGTQLISSAGSINTSSTITASGQIKSETSVTGTVASSYAMLLAKHTEAGVQVIAENSGSWAAWVGMTTGSRHYWWHNAPSGGANAGDLELRTSTATAADQIGGQGNGSTVLLQIGSNGLFTVDNDIKTNSRVGIGSIGSTSAPSIYLNTDTDTGIYFPAANQLGLVAGASRKVFIDSSTVDIQNAALKVGGYTLLDSSRNIYLGNSTTLRTDNNRETIADNPILLQTGTDLPWGSVVPQRPIPSIKTYAEAGNIGTNSTNYPDVYGEADLSGITGDATFTWAEAMQKAQELGGRLPTLEEIMSGSGAGSGQGYDSHLLWTQTPAGRGKYWAVQGSYSGTTNAEITDESTELRIRVYFDTTRNYKPVHYDYQSAIRTNTLRSIGSTLTIDADTTNFDGSVNGTTVNATSTMSITAGSGAELRVKDTTNNAEVVVLAQDSDGWVGTKSNHALKLGTNYNGRLYLEADGSALRPNGSSDSLDLGSDTHRFNNLYLKGDISAGGQTIAAEVGKFDASGTTPSSCKLHIGQIQEDTSSAIAQFGGFVRFGGALILHNGSASGNQTHIEYAGNDLGFTTTGGSATGAIRANGYKIGSGGSEVINSSREAFFTNMTLDSSADAALTINDNMTSAPARIHFNMTGTTTVGGGGAILFETSTSGTDAVYNARVEGIRTSSDNGSSELNFWTTSVANQTNAVKRVTITEGGNLQLHQNGSVTEPSLYFGADTNTGFYHPIGSGTADFIGITNGGSNSILIGPDDTYHYNESIFNNLANTSITTPNITSAETGTTAGTTRYHINFTRSGGTSTSRIGGITTNYYATTYATSSDYRLKENVNYDWDATTRLKQLRPCQFNWIGDTTNALIDGFLAHEVEDIVEDAVVGEKDATRVVDGETVIDPQSIDQSKLVPLLVKTIQELEARIAALEAQNP